MSCVTYKSLLITVIQEEVWNLLQNMELTIQNNKTQTQIMQLIYCRCLYCRYRSPLQTQKHYALPQIVPRFIPAIQKQLQRQPQRSIMLVQLPKQLRLSEEAIQRGYIKSDNPRR
ncbi:Hypothetical_protein [Hexamita inflata]|uniref:Hypothetical_protein n=1 Tax=Hexamita inflata TaxID=28002 RepID=A0AA86NAV6_9EUKA|nr:Hypothetical protein HINF_LOCUS3551 [Hexamita inflata]